MRTYAGHVRNRLTVRKEMRNDGYVSGAQPGASNSKVTYTILGPIDKSFNSKVTYLSMHTLYLGQ